MLPTFRLGIQNHLPFDCAIIPISCADQSHLTRGSRSRAAHQQQLAQRPAAEKNRPKRVACCNTYGLSCLHGSTEVLGLTEVRALCRVIVLTASSWKPQKLKMVVGNERADDTRLGSFREFNASASTVAWHCALGSSALRDSNAHLITFTCNTLVISLSDFGVKAYRAFFFREVEASMH